MPTFSIDNDRIAPGIQNLFYDQSFGAQTPTDGDEIDVVLSSGELDGLDADFETYLAGLGLSAAQKAYAVASDAGSSTSTFLVVSAVGDEVLNDLKLVADSTVALNITSLSGDALYCVVDATGNFARIQDAGGVIYGAVGLTGEVIDNAVTHTASAGVQMVFFKPILHTDTGSQDETINLGDALKVGADTAVTFNFEQLDAGNFLWAAVGSGSSAMLITGRDLNVVDNGPPAKIGNIDKGGNDPSDAVNTSKAAATTIGVNAQHFAPTNTGDGATCVFTFVSGLASLELATPQYTGQNVKQIDYDDFVNVSSATINISQLTGGTTARMHFSFHEAGGGEGTANVDGVDHLASALTPEEGYTGANSYIGNQDDDSHLKDDTAVNIGSVVINGLEWFYDDASNGSLQGGIRVTITGNDVEVVGATAGDNIKVIAVNDPGNPLDGTFNRINVQALQGSAAFDIGYISLDSGGLTSEDLGSHLYVDDDGPSILPSDDVSKPNNLEVANETGASDSSLFVLDAGSDGQKSFRFTDTPDSTGDFRWSYVDASQTDIIGTYKGVNLYSVSLNSNGTYTFTMLSELPGSTTGLTSTIIHAGGPTDTIDVAVAAPATGYARIVADSTVGAGLVNASHGFVGVDNGNLDTNEQLTLSLFAADDSVIAFSGITIGTKSAQSCHYDYFVTMENGDFLQVGDDDLVSKNGTITVMDPNGADDNLIVAVTVFKVDGNAVKIGLGDIDFIFPPDDQQFTFNVEMKDGDDDAVSSSFTVDIDGDGDGLYSATTDTLAAMSLPSGPDLSAELDGMARNLSHKFDEYQSFKHDYMVI